MKLKAAAQWMLAILLMAPCMQAQSVWNTTHLANVKRSIREPFYATAYETLKKEADRLSDAQPLSVMMKEKTPASGDKHDYMSQARYFWPDPAKPDGLPYINRDGISNPELNKLDRNRLWEQPPTASPPWHWPGTSAKKKNMPGKLLSLSVYGFWTKPPG